MSEIKLFNINGPIHEMVGGNVALEKELQTLIEKNMYAFFGVHFLASEYSTTDGGRMDSLGIDENNCPVIFEYKRSTNENVMNQGLFYLNWLLDHKDSFKVLVIEKLGLDAAKNIDWSMPRIICIAGDFTKYDASAIKQMTRNISLIRYKKYDNELLLFEQINENVVTPLPTEPADSATKKKVTDKTVDEQLAGATAVVKELYNDLDAYMQDMGEDITVTKLKLYVAYKKIRNVVCVIPGKTNIYLTLRLDPLSASKSDLESGFVRDVTSIGHWGTGNMEIEIKNRSDYEHAIPYIERAFHEN